MARRRSSRRRAPPSASSARPRPRNVSPPSTHEPVVPGSIPPKAAARSASADSPHAHAVCRHCGRIADVELTPEELSTLTALATQRPMDWSVEGITFSLTGTCPRCRAALVD